jgi:hypothetical protein
MDTDDFDEDSTIYIICASGTYIGIISTSTGPIYGIIGTSSGMIGGEVHVVLYLFL